jgi:hypothetical protein
MQLWLCVPGRQQFADRPVNGVATVSSTAKHRREDAGARATAIALACAVVWQADETPTGQIAAARGL